MLPNCCPVCNEKDEWKEVVNPFTTGIPIGKVRIKLIKTRGFGFYRLTYRCGKCGFEGKYDYRDES